MQHNLYYLTIKRNKLQLHAIQKTLKNMILSKRKQSQKAIYGIYIGMVLSKLVQDTTSTGKYKEPEGNW